MEINLNYTANLINEYLAAAKNYKDSSAENSFTIGSKKFKTSIDSQNKLVASEINDSTNTDGSDGTWGVSVNHLLTLNSIACGCKMCSHNYVELANASNEDINLNGIYLWYKSSTRWHKFPLKGIIKSGSTFVIRGNQINPIKKSFIKVDSYDMEWDISFEQENVSFCLILGVQDTIEDPKTVSGYIDSCGFGTGSIAEGNSPLVVNDDWNNLIFVRWFMFETASQGVKKLSARKTSALWTYIDLSKNTTKLGNSILYYYTDDIKLKYAPKASYLGKTFFTISTIFNSEKPNYVNMTFGRQATDNGSGATRCFNWISVGYYDEYVEIRKEGEDWVKHYSIIEDLNNPEEIQSCIDYYKRIKWFANDGTYVTTHKCIIKELTSGNYEYRIGRDDSDYSSKIYNFTVAGAVNNFTFIQTSDLQAFNWQEYQSWKKSAFIIAQEQNINFTINTGDIVQSGNRINEWLDYHDGRKYLDNIPEMFTIGNNDLGGDNDFNDGGATTSKYNHINALLYYTFEVDPNNLCEFEYEENTYPIYSTYSFNYGDYHFVSLNSEMTDATYKMFGNTEASVGFASAANTALENWFIKDLKIWKSTESIPTDCLKCIVYTHDAPFSIVTQSFIDGSDERGGSKLNTLNNNGEYRFSRLFKQVGIKLVLNGHKHTLAISKPIYDAPENYIVDNAINSEVDLLSEAVDSRKPVIQVTSADLIAETALARYEVVSEITAPVYVTCQATGYKLISNKELPGENIPWLEHYFPATGGKENINQHKPTYIKYTINDGIKVEVKLIDGIWDISTDKTVNDFNNQLSELGTNIIKTITI